MESSGGAAEEGDVVPAADEEEEETKEEEEGHHSNDVDVDNKNDLLEEVVVVQPASVLLDHDDATSAPPDAGLPPSAAADSVEPAATSEVGLEDVGDENGDVEEEEEEDGGGEDVVMAAGDDGASRTDAEKDENENANENENENENENANENENENENDSENENEKEKGDEGEGAEEGGRGDEEHGRQENEGEEGGVGEETHRGVTITVGSRTPVLSHDPLRALASSPPSGGAASQKASSSEHAATAIPGPPDQTKAKSGSEAANDSTFVGRERKKPVVEIEDMNGLKALMRSGWWKDAARLAEKLSLRTKWPHERLQFKMCAIISNMKSRQPKEAAEALNSLGDLESPSYSYEHYPQLYTDKRGSMVPFTLFMIRAELQSLVTTDGLARSLDSLFTLLDYCRSQLSRLKASTSTPVPPSASEQCTLSNADLDALSSLSLGKPAVSSLSASLLEDLDQDILQTWRGREVRILFSISTRYIQAADYAAALRTLATLVSMYPKDVILLSAVGRLLLQWGNLAAAERYFREVEQLADSSKSALILMNKGLECISRDRYSDAIRAFDSVLELEPDNMWAANNRAVCYLYVRDLQRAIASLEQLIASNPESNITDAVIFNLCTMYDLESDNSAAKKKNLHTIISQFIGDDFDYNIIKTGS